LSVQREWALTGAVLPDGSRSDVLVIGERIAAVGDGAAKNVKERIDATGKLLLPAFVDIHIHLDKVLIRDELNDHDGTLAGAISAIHERKRRYTEEDVRARARRVIELSVMHGCTRLRSHVDVDTIGGLIPLLGVQAAARDCIGLADLQTVAFPQEGILRDPGALALLEAALEAGADVVGGMPHWEHTRAEQLEHVRLCFELAVRFNKDVDMHVDETDDGSVRTLEMVADETERLGWQGRVTVGHVCSLAAADESYVHRVIGKCLQQGITVVSNPVTNLVIQGRADRGLIRRGTTRVAELRQAGVNVAFGQDCVHDGFYPFGRGDMLEVALISAHATHLSSRADFDFALQALTEAPARSWRLTDYGIHPGARADLQLFSSPSWAEVLRLQKPPEHVWRAGREVARTTIRSELLRSGADEPRALNKAR
jgi:cytosine/creatinine deaminase